MQFSLEGEMPDHLLAKVSRAITAEAILVIVVMMALVNISSCTWAQAVFRLFAVRLPFGRFGALAMRSVFMTWLVTRPTFSMFTVAGSNRLKAQTASRDTFFYHKICILLCCSTVDR